MLLFICGTTLRDPANGGEDGARLRTADLTCEKCRRRMEYLAMHPSGKTPAHHQTPVNNNLHVDICWRKEAGPGYPLPLTVLRHSGGADAYSSFTDGVHVAFRATTGRCDRLLLHLRRLGLIDRSDPFCEMIAHKVIAVGKTGVADASTISEIILRQISES
jgi:hypothetical protein